MLMAHSAYRLVLRMTKKDDTIVAWKQIEEVCTTLVKDAYAIFTSLGAQVGAGSREVHTKFLCFFVETMVTKALNEYPPKPTSKADLYEFTRRNFEGVKQGVTDAVARGFERALKEYSGKETEYYCVVRTVPEPVSKSVN